MRRFFDPSIDPVGLILLVAAVALIALIVGIDVGRKAGQSDRQDIIDLRGDMVTVTTP